jgi:hypothetical protein
MNGEQLLVDGGPIGIMIGIVLAASLVLQTALGPVVANMVETIKRAGLVRQGRAGLVSLALGTALGVGLGVMAYAYGPQHDPIWIGVGAFAGLVGLGAGGVRSHLVLKGIEQSQATASGEIKAGVKQALKELAADGAFGGVPTMAAPSLLDTTRRSA